MFNFFKCSLIASADKRRLSDRDVYIFHFIFNVSLFLIFSAEAQAEESAVKTDNGPTP